MAVPNSTTTAIPTYEERSACETLSYTWATAYDTKNWTLLTSVLSPTLCIDYTAIRGPSHNLPSQPAASYVADISAQENLGQELVATQHLLGASTWHRTSPTAITATWQIRATHVRFAAAKDTQGKEGNGGKGGKEVVDRAVGHGPVEHFYERGEDGVWRFKGVKPDIIFMDGDMGKVMGWEG